MPASHTPLGAIMTTAGRQPEKAGRLQCLECGRWFRLLPPHLGRAHAASAAEYRAAHRLPRTLSLRAADLNERAREQGHARYVDRPDIRAIMAAGREVVDLRNASAGTKATSRYEMVLDARRRGGRARRAASVQRMDSAAHSAGFPGMRVYLAVRDGAAVAAMARELAVPRTTVTRWIAHLRSPLPSADSSPQSTPTRSGDTGLGRQKP